MSNAEQSAERPLAKIRNIGVIAHIDAGKTTLSERFLFYSGKTHRMGDIDEGNTVMDYLEEERGRGITIVAAAASLPWTSREEEFLYHLIDTPGHIDFTAEVERSLRVADGAVVVFSGVEGVEAQSEKVWRQSTRYGVPKIVFVNKLDRLGADFQRVVGEIAATFTDAVILPTQMPVGIESDLRGVVDLVTMRMLVFEGEQGERVMSLDVPAGTAAAAMEARDRMVAALADVSDDIAAKYLEDLPLPPELLRREIRAATLANKLCPVLCGSAKRNIGIQPIMDAVADYLPSPAEVAVPRATSPKTGDEVSPQVDDPHFSGLVFKLVAATGADLLYLRAYTGSMAVGDTMLNPRSGEKVKIKRLLRLYAKNVEPVESVGAGDIVGLIGPHDTFTGDTLCAPPRPLAFEKIVFPEPVISIAIEPKSGKDKDRLAEVLAIICREDPTLRIKHHENTGQQILSGMGELHLEIACNRVARDFNLEARFGAPQVAFRETITGRLECVGVFDRIIGEQHFFAEVEFALEPMPRLKAGVEVALAPEVRKGLPGAWTRAATEALENGLRTGGNWGYPLVDIRGVVRDIRGAEGKTGESAIVGATLEGLSKALQRQTKLLEPLMKLEIVSPEANVGEISGYLQSRRAVIQGVDNLPGAKRMLCEVPLAEMFGFSKALPKLSGGRAAFSMEPCGYQEISEEELRRVAGN